MGRRTADNCRVIEIPCGTGLLWDGPVVVTHFGNIPLPTPIHLEAGQMLALVVLPGAING